MSSGLTRKQLTYQSKTNLVKIKPGLSRHILQLPGPAAVSTRTQRQKKYNYLVHVSTTVSVLLMYNVTVIYCKDSNFLLRLHAVAGVAERLNWASVHVQPSGWLGPRRLVVSAGHICQTTPLYFIDGTTPASHINLIAPVLSFQCPSGKFRRVAWPVLVRVLSRDVLT